MAPGLHPCCFLSQHSPAVRGSFWTCSRSGARSAPWAPTLWAPASPLMSGTAFHLGLPTRGWTATARTSWQIAPGWMEFRCSLARPRERLMVPASVSPAQPGPQKVTTCPPTQTSARPCCSMPWTWRNRGSWPSSISTPTTTSTLSFSWVHWMLTWSLAPVCWSLPPPRRFKTTSASLQTQSAAGWRSLRPSGASIWFV